MAGLIMAIHRGLLHRDHHHCGLLCQLLHQAGLCIEFFLQQIPRYFFIKSFLYFSFFFTIVFFLICTYYRLQSFPLQELFSFQFPIHLHLNRFRSRLLSLDSNSIYFSNITALYNSFMLGFDNSHHKSWLRDQDEQSTAH